MKSFQEWLKAIDHNHKRYDPIIVEGLLKAYAAANGADCHQVFEDTLSGAPIENQQKMREYYRCWRDEFVWPKKKCEDMLGRKVKRVYIMTDRFCIYSVDDDDDSEDVCGLRYALPDGYDACAVLRAKLNAFAPEIAYITDAVCSMRPIRGTDRNFRVFRERIFEMLAMAMAAVLENQPAEAEKIIQQARNSVDERHNSVTRMRYMTANTISTALIIIAGLAVLAYPEVAATVPTILSLGENAAAGAIPGGLSIVPVLMAGALGAFFSVALSLKNLKVSWSITLSEVVFSGLARVWIGVIAAGVVIWMIQGKWILASVADGSMASTVLLFGFIAGFSEMFVPNALTKIEKQNQVKEPAETAGSSATARIGAAANSAERMPASDRGVVAEKSNGAALASSSATDTPKAEPQGTGTAKPASPHPAETDRAGAG